MNVAALRPPPRRWVLLTTGLLLMSLLVLLASCQSTSARVAEASPPVDWAYAVLESPVDPWSGDSTARLTLLDEHGQRLWDETFDGLQNGYLTARADGSLLFSGATEDATYVPGVGVTRVNRSISQEREVVSHSMTVNDNGIGLALFNEGFSDSPMGYSFFSSRYDEAGTIASSSIDGYVQAVWSCETSEWSAAVRSMSVPGDSAANLIAHVGSFSPSADFQARTEWSLPPGMELSPDPYLPCHGSTAVLLSASIDPLSEAIRPTTTQMALWHFENDEVRPHQLSDWPDLQEGGYLAHDSSVVDDTFFWVTAEGQLFSAPLAGGPVTHTGELSLPSPLPVDAVVKFVGHSLLVSLPSGRGQNLSLLTLGDTSTSKPSIRLDVSPPDNRVISDIVLSPVTQAGTLQ